MLAFKDNADGYYEFRDDAPPEWYAGLTPTALRQKSLAETRQTKLEQMEQARKQAIASLPLVTVAGKQYPATPEYREIITGIARRQAAGRPIPATLRGADGTPATLNAALIGQIDDAITAAVQSAWDRYWQRFDAVQAATTVEQVDAIVW